MNYEYILGIRESGIRISCHRLKPCYATLYLILTYHIIDKASTFKEAKKQTIIETGNNKKLSVAGKHNQV